MREAAQILLGLMQYANRTDGVWLNHSAIASILDSLKLTEQETFEIGEILQADIREKAASKPQSEYDEINQIMSSIVPDKFKHK